MWWLVLVYMLDDGSRSQQPFWAWDTEAACQMEGEARVNGVTIVDFDCRFISEGDTVEM